jgi:CHAP domain
MSVATARTTFDKGGKVLPRGRPSKNRPYRGKGTALALVLVLLTAGLISVSAEPAFAGDEPAFGTLEVGASNWMTGNGGGVDVYSNGDSGFTGTDYSSPAVGLKWQCVELTQRLYQAKGWHSGYWTGVTYAYQIYDNASANGLVAHPNDGNYTPVPGDMIIHSPSTSDVAGHVAVVDYVSNGKVYVVEQNVATSGESSAGHASYTIGSNGVLTRDQSVGLSIRGIVHSPNDPYTNNSDYRAAFQANTGYMFTNDWPGGPANTAQGMRSSTNPAVAFLSTGGYEVTNYGVRPS